MAMKMPPDAVRAARGDMSHKDAAALIDKSYRTWQNWETESKSKRGMDKALYDLFLIRKKESCK